MRGESKVIEESTRTFRWVRDLIKLPPPGYNQSTSSCDPFLLASSAEEETVVVRIKDKGYRKYFQVDDIFRAVNLTFQRYLLHRNTTL